MSFWAELSRRNVVRVAVAYFAAAWLLIQVAAIVVPTFGLPDWTMRGLLALAAVGLVLTAVLAWIYDLTPDGVRRTDDLPSAQRAARLGGRKLDFVIIGLLSLALVGVVFDRYWLDDRSRTIDTFLSEGTTDLVSDFPGSHSEPALSPDGTMLAFVSDASGSRQIWVKDLAQGEPIQITSGEFEASSPVWSPRNDQILFQRQIPGQNDGPIPSLFSVGPLGTPEARLLVERGSTPSFASDGSRFVYAVGREIWIADADGSNRRQVEDLPASPGSAGREPVLSPDGSLVAFVNSITGPAGEIWVVPTDGGEARVLTNHAAAAGIAGAPSWSADGRHILYAAGGFGSRHLWRVDVDTGEALPLTTGTGGYDSPSMSADGTALVYTNRRSVWRLMRSDTATGMHATVYESRNPIVLPQVSPDGQTVVFFTQLAAGVHVFTIGIDGRNLRQITFDDGGLNTLPAWSDSGDAIYYYRGESLHRISPEGGSSVEVVPEFHWSSRNWLAVYGNRLAYREYGFEPGLGQTVIKDLDSETDTVFRAPPVIDIKWSRDGSELLGRLFNLNLVICSVASGDCEDLMDGETVIRGEHPRWSADESRVFLQRGSIGRPLHRNLWVVDRDGQNLTMLFEYGPLDEGYYISIGRDDELVWNQVDRGADEIWIARRP